MLVDTRTKSLIMRVDDPFMIRDLLTKSRVIKHAHYNVQIKHTVESTRILRNIGYDVPAPIQHEYSWPGKYTPFDHQRVMAEFLTMHRRCFNLSEMGTGKTAATLWAADHLIAQGMTRRALILTPLSTMERVWVSDIFNILMHRVVSKVYGDRERRLEALDVDAEFYVLNHDGVKIGPVRDAIRKRPDIDLVIVDEGSMFRNHDSKKYKALERMLRPDQRLWWLTGTPCPNEPTDAWAQARLVNPANVPKFYGSFRAQTMMKMGPYKWAAKHDAYDLAYKAMQPAVRFKKADCLDLPPVMTEERQAELTPEQKQAVKHMRNMMIAEAKNQTVTAVNAADKINKLRQIMCGSIKMPDGTYVDYPHKPRVDVMIEAIEQASAKVLIIVPFKGITQALEKELMRAGYTVGLINGDVSPKRRDQIILDFKNGKDPHILLCHPKVMSHGLNLTEADTLIFYAPIYSNDEFQQVTERFNRAGQTRKMTIIRIAAHPLEWEIYRMIDNRKLTQDNILELYKVVTE
jgi:SNF2 family DNA or RNA helicase